MLVIKLGGCNGSGKSSVARALLDKYKMKPMDMDRNGRPRTYATGLTAVGGSHRLVVLGRYETACGGMDTISDKEERLALVKEYASHPGNVVFYEGLITGKTYGAMGALSEEPGQFGRWLYAFMDTPFEVCVERVKTRRRAKALEKAGPAPSDLDILHAGKYADELDAERTMRPTFKSIHATEARARSAGHRTLWLPHDKTPAQIAAFLMKHAEKML